MYAAPWTSTACDPRLCHAGALAGTELQFVGLLGTTDHRGAGPAFLREHRSALVKG
jgi:hypothetical protein